MQGGEHMRYQSNAVGFHAGRISIRKYFCRALPFLLIIAIVILWIRLDHAIRPYAEKICLYECRSLTSQLTAESISETIAALSSMDLTLTSMTYDADGTITGIHADAQAVNTVQAVLLENVNAALEEARQSEFSVHIGTLTGSHLLTGRGAELPLRYIPLGSAEVALQSEFSSAGINQTIHTLTAEITIHAGCSVPLYAADSEQSYTYLLAETVIVGDVPALQWNSSQFPAVS